MTAQSNSKTDNDLKSIHPSSNIHPTALIYPGAVIGEGTEVGPYSVIGPKVVLGARNRVGPHVVIEGNTRLGNDNQVFQFASVGSRPQDLKYKGEDSTVEIGDRNIIREYVTIQPGTEGGGMRTTIGHGNLFMASSHIGHDGHVGDGNIFANCATLAGHVTVGNFVTVGGLSAIHQFVRLGDISFLAGGAMVSQDIPPYCMAHGNRAKLVGLNSVGLARKGFATAEITKLKVVYRELFVSANGNFKTKLTSLIEKTEKTPLTNSFLEFISSSSRGIAVGARGKDDSEDED